MVERGTASVVNMLVEGQMFIESVTPSSFSDLEIGTLWPATSTDDTVFVHRDLCAVDTTIASDLSGFIASPLLRNHWHSSVRRAAWCPLGQPQKRW